MVTPNGSKLWRFNYYKPNSKKRTEMSLGTFPNVSLQVARIKRAECRELLAKGIDPQDHREQQQQAQQAELTNTYENVAWAWFEYRKSKRNFSEGYQKDVESLIRRNLLPHFGHLPISQITALMALKAFKQYQDEGKLEK